MTDKKKYYQLDDPGIVGKQEKNLLLLKSIIVRKLAKSFAGQGKQIKSFRL